MLDLDALTNSVNSNSYDSSVGYNSGEDDDEDMILPFLSKYPYISNLMFMLILINSFNHEVILLSKLPLHKELHPNNAIEDLMSFDDFIIDDGYNYFRNSTHENYPSIKTNTIQSFSYTNWMRKWLLILFLPQGFIRIILG